MFELKAEKINGKVFVCIEDLVELLDGSAKKSKGEFGNALTLLSSHLKDIEADAKKGLDL